MDIAQIVALVIATLVPLVVLYVIHTLDFYNTGAFLNIALAFGWGAASVWLALQVNEYAYYNLLDRQYLPLTRYVAPAAEEILKALVLLYLVRRSDFTYFVDGAIYGFAAGVGFAVFENYIFINNNPAMGLGTAVSRVLSANLMHATASAVVGIAVGRSRFGRFSNRFFFLLGGLALAMVVHSAYNHLVTNETVTGGLLLFFSAVLGMAGIATIGMIIRRGLREERVWIEEKLGAADRVTTQEAAVVQRLEDAPTVLAPLVEIFGQDKADKIEEFLVLQARLGIKRKTLEKLEGNERLQASVEKEMDEIRAQMDEARRDVGAYTMVALRSLFPPEESPVWQRLESQIQDSIAAQPARTGPSLFDRAGSVLAARNREQGETPGRGATGGKEAPNR